MFIDLPDWVRAFVAEKHARKKERSTLSGEPVSCSEIVARLRYLDPGQTYPEWRDVVAAIAATNVPDGDTQEIADAWSRGEYWPQGQPFNYDGPEAVEVIFDTMPPTDDGVSFGTIDHLARAAGYDGPRIGQRSAEETFKGVQTVKPADTRYRKRSVQKTRQRLTYLIPGMIPDHGQTLIYAPWDSYKSFVATDLAFSIATGTKAFGALEPTRTGPVLYLAGEGIDGLERLRITALAKDRGIEDTDECVPLWTTEGVPHASNFEEGVAYVKDALAQLGGVRPGCVVIDTFARSMEGLNENDASDCGRYLGLSAEIGKALNCPVITIAHSGKAKEKGVRASSALPAGIENIWEIDAERDVNGKLTGRAVVKNVRMRDGHAMDDMHIKRRTVRLEDDEDTLVFDHVERDPNESRVNNPLSVLNLTIALKDAGMVSPKVCPTEQLAGLLVSNMGFSPDDTDGMVAKTDDVVRELKKLARLPAYGALIRESGWNLPQN
jgi:hypothetical protein